VRVREVADPKCRCAGVGRSRWILETPRSALPARASVHAGGEFSVGEQLSVEGVGDPAFEAPQRFHAGLAGRELSQEVGPSGSFMAQLDDGGDVQDVVHPAVTGAGESVSDLLTGGCVQGGTPVIDQPSSARSHYSRALFTLRTAVVRVVLRHPWPPEPREA
jgi:hypothetical protein